MGSCDSDGQVLYQRAGGWRGCRRGGGAGRSALGKEWPLEPGGAPLAQLAGGRGGAGGGGGRVAEGGGAAEQGRQFGRGEGAGEVVALGAGAAERAEPRRLPGGL